MSKLIGEVENISYSFIRDCEVIGEWIYAAMNVFTERSCIVKHLTYEQVGACLALMAVGDFTDDYVNEHLWSIASEALGSVHDEIRIIP